MAERTLPWWRKVIDYAISGIRSLLRPARPNAGEVTEPAARREEIFAKPETVAEQVPQAAVAAEPAAQHAVAPFVPEPDPVIVEVASGEDTAAGSAIEKHEPQPEPQRELRPEHEEESAIVVEEQTEPVAEEFAAHEPVAEEPVAEEIAVAEPTAAPEEPIEIKAPGAAVETAREEPRDEEHFSKEHAETVPIEERALAPEPIAEYESLSDKEPRAEQQVDSEAEPEPVPMKEETVQAAMPAEPNVAVEEDSSMEPEEAVMELSEAKAEEESAAPIEATAATEAAPACEEPFAETAAEPLGEATSATSDLETEAPQPQAGKEVSQPEEEAQEVAAAPSAARQTTPPAPAKTEAEIKTAARIVAAVKAREESADPSPFSILVDQVYDGPLDLLLDLIRKQDIDIYDIPIAKITAQFLAYVNQLKASDVDVAGEFIYTASLLIHIKSKMLLPRAPGGPDDAAEDPRRELVERLLEHEKFKNAAQMLQQKQMLEAATWTNPGVREFKDDDAAEPEIAADTVDLVRIFQVILDRARNRPILNVQEDSVTVGQMIQFLTRRLTMEDKPVALSKLLANTKSERALIAMFLALLELVRLQAILLRQDRHFTDIFIKKNSGFETAMEQSLANARDDWR